MVINIIIFLTTDARSALGSQMAAASSCGFSKGILSKEEKELKKLRADVEDKIARLTNQIEKGIEILNKEIKAEREICASKEQIFAYEMLLIKLFDELAELIRIYQAQAVASTHQKFEGEILRGKQKVNLLETKKEIFKITIKSYSGVLDDEESSRLDVLEKQKKILEQGLATKLEEKHSLLTLYFEKLNEINNIREQIAKEYSKIHHNEKYLENQEKRFLDQKLTYQSYYQSFIESRRKLREFPVD